MYIDYEKIGQKLGFGKSLFYNLKLNQNLRYIKKNQKKVLENIKNKKVLNVFFYVYDASKWKSQSIYDLMAKDERFNPVIIVTKNCAIKGNANYQTSENVKECHEFFDKKGMNVKYGYDIEKNEYIPFESFNPKPDLIFYSHPWYVYKTQGPVMCSKFALTYYIPYFVPASVVWFDYDLRFHKYLFRYYVTTSLLKDIYSESTKDKDKRFKAVGHPIFDNYQDNADYEKKYIIYAPHWTVCGDNLRIGTFTWSGYKILDFARQHKALNWVFRPHPLFYEFILTSGYMPKEELDKYYEEWGKIGIISKEGDYTDLFKESFAMITDCASFLTEYAITENPLIHLISGNLKPNVIVCELDKTYYLAHSQNELDKHLEEVILQKRDYKKESRIKLLERLQLKSENCATLIINDILETIK